MNIGRVILPNPVVAAPMAGVTDKAFRLLAREAGCGLICTEMISDQALIHNNNRTMSMLDLSQEEGLISVQIFGSQPSTMAEAARFIADSGADIVDINMGCPAPKIVKNGEGSALMRDLPRAAEIITAVVDVSPIPVTVKMRKGWSDREVNAVELAVLAQEKGAAAVTVHGRTREQYYSGQADWQIIKEVKAALTIPVIGNGDIWKPQDALRMMEETGCDGVMIGRGAMGNPWLFTATVHYLATGELLPPPTAGEKIEMAIRHLAMVSKHKGERIAVKEMRKHAAWYIKGLRDAARIREQINKAQTEAEVTKVLRQYLKYLE
ncbi:MAG: tRNA dihydrouridine synthase DusB [Clostridia bacterium]|nr:tRNA dihydrouridine synthase DusB [Clostridia bacterium]